MTPLPLPSFDLGSPGTLLYDGPLSTRGYRLNLFCLSLKRPANRTRFLTDEQVYARGFGLDDGELALVAARDWTGLINAGGHLQAVLKLAATVDCNIYHIGGHALGISAQQMQLACPRQVAGVPDIG